MHDLFDPYAYNIRLSYQAYRTNGESRSSAIDRIREEYSGELQDSDDRVAVLMAIAQALCRKKELTSELAEETLSAIGEYRACQKMDTYTKKYLARIEAKLTDLAMIGPEAHYPKRRQYIPDWQTGDLFSHTLTHPQSEKLGIHGWIILFYKVGEFSDRKGKLRQLMFITLCPPGKEPTTDRELEQLGFLRMMPAGCGYDYFVQIVPKSKKDEQGYGLTRIGNFMNVTAPTDWAKENPLVSMPMFAYLRKDDLYPSYENHICLLYKQLGLSQPPNP